ncbi:ninja-family protein 5-like [Syzygium oleosum]|uniref:ninja-family protein 5-like n=1 Tax=Syzygium oleosum TaxID=219896 RepID=UPI0011D201EA|nr:ninja-family protein 5-like [Syzygium oleosum]
MLGSKEEELEDAELDLVLSIGGSYGRSERAREPGKGLALEGALGSSGEDSGGARKDGPVSPGSTGSDLETGGSGSESDPERKRAMQAMGRFEAMRKREEKRQRKGAGGGGGADDAGGRSDPAGEPARKKAKEEGANVEPGAEGAAGTAHPACPPYLVVPVQFPYGPFVNGYGFPYWVQGPGKDDGAWGLGQNVSEQSSSGKKSASSNGSQVCSSSGVSDCQGCSGRQGGTSCDAKNQSTASSRKRRLPERNSPHHQSKSAELTDEPKNLLDEKADSTSPTRSTDPSKPKEDTGLETQGPPRNPYRECADQRSASPNGGAGKPPRPSLPLLRMPRVSTTGNGLNGKTVNGFLHKYTKAEISIVCTCHGFTFSPAEFVEHAGGTNVLHPLRHITMLP